MKPETENMEMRRLITVFSAVCLVALGAMVVMAAVPNYAGTWSLDKSKSGELPRMWQNADSVQMAVTQNDKQITVAIKAGMGGDTLAYNLDGSTTSAELGGRMPGKATLSAKVNDNGSLELKTAREVNFQGNPVTINVKENWELADGGKTLKVTRVMESPRGTQTYNLVFTKQ
jgi:hypothetical protein